LFEQKTELDEFGEVYESFDIEEAVKRTAIADKSNYLHEC